MFSFYFTEAGDLSWVDLGEPDYENVREGENVVDIPFIEEDFFYAQYCQGIAVGDKNWSEAMVWGTLDNVDTEVDNTFYTIVETGSTALMISDIYYESLIEKIMEKVPARVEWEFRDDFVYTEC